MRSSLIQKFTFNPETGAFKNRVAAGRYPAGYSPGWTTGHGYTAVVFLGKTMYVHRLAWLYVYGEMPDLIDHINRNRSDNRIANLRKADRCINAQNSMTRSVHNGRPVQSKYRGVHWSKGAGKWCAMITYNHVRKHLGLFVCEEQAANAYEKARAIFHIPMEGKK